MKEMNKDLVIRQKSIATIKQQYAHGRKPWNFNPDKEREYPLSFNNELKTFVRNLNGRHCVICQCYDYSLSVHHINWNKTETFIWNLVTLCTACHMRAHSPKRHIQYQIDLYNYTSLRDYQTHSISDFSILDLNYGIHNPR